MTESEAINIIKLEVEKTIPAISIKVLERNFKGCSIYTATIMAYTKDGTIIEQTLKDIIYKITNDGITDIKVVGTKRDLNDVDFEILICEAEIII